MLIFRQYARLSAQARRVFVIEQIVEAVCHSQGVLDLIQRRATMMDTAASLRIDLAEEFPHLSKAPIVEAVIEVRCFATEPWEEKAITERLKPQLAAYPSTSSAAQFRQEIKMTLDAPPSATKQDLGWKGLRAQSSDGKQIAMFFRDRFAFSRLTPYENWERFKNEAIRLWTIHAELGRPVEIERMSIRFVNRFQIPAGEGNFEAYIQPHPEAPRGLNLPFFTFFHQDILVVPGLPYQINLVRASQPPEVPGGVNALIVDIEISTLLPFGLDSEIVRAKLSEMRWLKNKVFFGSITDRAREAFL